MDTMYTDGVLDACVVPRPVVSWVHMVCVMPGLSEVPVVSWVHMVCVMPGLSEVPVVSWASVVSSFSDGYCS